jgi:hypothetical protein
VISLDLGSSSLLLSHVGHVLLLQKDVHKTRLLFGVPKTSGSKINSDGPPLQNPRIAFVAHYGMDIINVLLPYTNGFWRRPHHKGM